MTAYRSLSSVAAIFVALSASGVVRAELADEIQVYVDDINKPGQHGLELHLNTFPSARKVPDYPGEVTPNHTLYGTLEPSLGITDTLEIGMYLPFAHTSDGGLYSGGVKGRIKWLPIQADTHGGFYAGANFELGYLPARFSDVSTDSELRFMLGWHDDEWLIGLNPTLGWEFSDGASGKPGFSLGVKASRRVAEGVAMGFEYYDDRGPLTNALPHQQQDHQLFYVIDVDRGPWVFNFGIGTGLTDAAPNTTVKMIFELPI